MEDRPAGGVNPPAGLFALCAVMLIVAWACGSGGGESADPIGSTARDETQAQAAGTEAGASAGFDVQGHRGARGLKPENTLPAFEAALDLGVTTLELDLHLTADDEVVVWHDPEVSPDKCLGNPDFYGRRLAETTAAELRGLRCAENPDPNRFPDQDAEPTALAGDDFGIVTLAQLFDFVSEYAESPDKTDPQRRGAASVEFNVETKRKPSDPAAIGDEFDGISPGTFETALVDVVRSAGLADRVIVQSFDHRSLWAIHTVAPELRLAALTSRNEPFNADFATQGAAIWSPSAASLDQEAIDTAHAAGMKVIPWTVNDVDDMTRLIGWGVDGIITDRPDLLIGAIALE